ncbi:helix-turn-helix domain-containing protein [Paenibacillus hexagrammi]|uniref:Helix-turn-helix domain-containing protein n=1 Tax=Paenibacillus hexagrammi TaxID=2908839 RepID=A0ABY3SRM3_9BACL|nr:helix-turn-helix domain-containing protein [Paenibacillus sp. YPD9-1]UJF36599.1 helix-turn-helix domain-containing protein [Paenibacillus sp. YPD9-1]
MSESQQLSITYDDSSYGVVGTGADIFVKMHVSARTSGLMREMPPDLWKTLCALATYMDASGYCYPTIEQVAYDIGVSYRTAQRWLDKLCKFRWNGEPIVVKSQGRFRGGNYANNRYNILPLSQLSIFDGKVELPEVIANGMPTDNEVHSTDWHSIGFHK